MVGNVVLRPPMSNSPNSLHLAATVDWCVSAARKKRGTQQGWKHPHQRAAEFSKRTEGSTDSAPTATKRKTKQKHKLCPRVGTYRRVAYTVTGPCQS